MSVCDILGKYMLWRDQAVIVRQRPFAERQWIVTLLTHQHGLHKGLVKEGSASGWMIGSQTEAIWESPCANGLGHFRLDPAYGPAPLSLHMPSVLHALELLCLLCAFLLPERVAMPSIYACFLKTMALLPTSRGLQAYNLFEERLLEELGYGHSESTQELSPLDALFRRRQCFRKHWPDQRFLDTRRMRFLQEVSHAFHDRTIKEMSLEMRV